MEKKPNILKNVLVMGIVTLLFSVVTISMILVLGIKPSTQFYVFAGIVITAISGIFTAYINSNNAYKDELREVEKRITKNIVDIGDKYRAKFENIEDDVFKNQTEMSRKTNEFMIESVTSIKSDIKTIQQDFTEFKSEVKEIKSTLDEMTSIKEKREMSYNFNIRGFSPKGRYFISLSIVIACVVSGIFTGVYAKINDLELQPLIFLIVICGIVGVIFNLITFSKYRYVIMLNKMIKAHCAEQDEIKEKLKRLYVEADKLKAGIKNSSADFVNKDEAIMYEIRTQNLSCNP